MLNSRKASSSQSFSAIAETAMRMNSEGHYKDADDLVLGVLRDNEKSPGALLCYVNLARDRGDLLGVVERASRLRHHLPSNPVGYLREIEALRILGQIDLAKRVLDKAVERFSGMALFLLEEAFLAEAEGNWDIVDLKMASIRTAMPHELNSWFQSAKSLMRSGRYQLADDLLNQAPNNIQRDAKILSLRATLSESLRQWHEADRRWEAALSLYPDQTDIALGHALIWSNPPRSDQSSRDWPKTFERIDLLEKRFPDFVGSYIARIQLLQQLNKPTDAEIFAEKAAQIFPQNSKIAILRSRLAAKHNCYDKATNIILDLIEQTPNDPLVHAELAAVLRQSKRLDDAEAVCKEACNRFPYHPRSFMEYAEIAMQRGDANACLQRWADGALRFPQHDAFQRGVAAAHLTLIGIGHEEITAFTEGSISVGQDASLRRQFFEFESLGGPNFGCEFGLVQQRSGANPLSLLRWADISITNLQSALRLRFEGVGDSEQTDLVLHPESEEYSIVDQRFSIRMHSFLRYDSLPRDLLVEDTSRRLTYLKNKLVKDLSHGKKIFVFRLRKSEVNLEEIFELYSQFEKVSPGVLLCVATASEGRQHPGLLTVLAPRLLLGYVDKLQTWGLTNFAPWYDICRQAREFLKKEM